MWAHHSSEGKESHHQLITGLINDQLQVSSVIKALALYLVATKRAATGTEKKTEAKQRLGYHRADICLRNDC